MTTMTDEPVRTHHRVKTSLPPEFLKGQEKYRVQEQPMTLFLGLFSIGLGLWEIVKPESVAEVSGVRHPALLRAYGVREIMAGVGILTQRRPSGWLWARVMGDVLDLATAGHAYLEAESDEDRRKTCITMGALASVTLMDVIAANAHVNT